jgi:Tfp pilus assembly protein PilN
MQFLGKNFDIESQQSVVLVPGYYFFTESVQLPTGISADEISDFLEYNLEDISPFPIEQLHWGYITHKDSPTALIYAAYKPRLKTGISEDLDKAHHVLPSFLTLYGLSTEENAWYFVQYKDNICAQFYEAGNTIPLIVENIKIEGDPENIEDVFTAKNELIHLLPDLDAVVDSGIVKCEGIKNEDDSISFSHQHYASAASFPSNIENNEISGSEIIWNADIRDQAYADKELKRRTLEAKLWKAMTFAGIAASILLTFEVGQIVSNILIKGRDKEIAQQIEPVARIQVKEQSLEQLKKLFHGELQPFDMLEVTNQARSNDQIYYLSVDSISDNTNNRYTITGEAPSISAANSFYANLASSPHLLNVEAPQTKPSLNNKVKFTISLNFKSSIDGETPVAMQTNK